MIIKIYEKGTEADLIFETVNGPTWDPVTHSSRDSEVKR